MEAFDDLRLRRVGEGHDPAAAVERGGDPVFQHVAELGHAPGEHHLPHLGVHMVEEGDLGAARPHGAEERHPVPDLHQTVTRTDAADGPGQDRAREDGVPSGPPDDPVAVPAHHTTAAGHRRGGQRHVQPGLRPRRDHPMGMELAPTRFGVVEVPPGEDVDPLETGTFGDLVERHTAEQGDRCGTGAGPAGRMVGGGRRQGGSLPCATDPGHRGVVPVPGDGAGLT